MEEGGTRGGSEVEGRGVVVGGGGRGEVVVGGGGRGDVMEEGGREGNGREGEREGGGRRRERVRKWREEGERMVAVGVEEGGGDGGEVW